jgi:hypothetical protein
MPEFLTAVAAVTIEVLGVVRAALVSWPVTARLCVILVVVAATMCHWISTPLTTVTLVSRNSTVFT